MLSFEKVNQEAKPVATTRVTTDFTRVVSARLKLLNCAGLPPSLLMVKSALKLSNRSLPVCMRLTHTRMCIGSESKGGRMIPNAVCQRVCAFARAK